MMQYIKLTNSLLLATANLLATCSHIVVISTVQLTDKFMCIGNLCSSNNLLLCGIILAKGNILTNTSVKEYRLLSN